MTSKLALLSLLLASACTTPQRLMKCSNGPAVKGPFQSDCTTENLAYSPDGTLVAERVSRGLTYYG